MRFIAVLAICLVGTVLVQSQLVVPQLNPINALISFSPQLQSFVQKLDTILPQFLTALTNLDLQALKEQLTQVVLNNIGAHIDINTLKDKLRPVIEQFLKGKSTPRLDIDALLQQVANAATSSLPSIILNLLGKRDATDARLDMDDILAFVNKIPLNTIIPQIQQFLSGDKLQQLQNQFFSTVLAAVGNKWNIASLSQALQQLVGQFVPQITTMRIDWDSVAQSALNAVITAAPTLLFSLFGKRDATDARLDMNDVLAFVNKIPLNTIIPQIQQFLSGDKLQQLQNQFFSTVLAAVGNKWNVASLSQALQQLVGQFVPQITTMRIDWDSVAQSALNAVISAAPTLLFSLFGKRDVSVV